MLLTRGFSPANGSAIDPLVEEVTWQAKEMTAFDPGRVSQAAVQSANIGFDCLIEALALKGRAAAISELDVVDGEVTARLAVGVFGSRGSTEHEALGLSPRIASAVNGAGLFAARTIDPTLVVPGEDTDWPATEQHAAHLVQDNWVLGDDEDLIEIVSRFNPTVEPWAGIVDQVVQLPQALRIRATVLATALTPADRLEIDRDLARLRQLRARNQGRLELEFDVDRGEATLLDVRASFASPVLACEVAVSSPEPLSETLLRSLAASFTSETDVLRQQGRIVVASNRLVLGGFEIQRDPGRWREAQRVGVPLRGGLGPRQLRDLVTLTESPIGWPVAPGRAIPGVDSHLPVIRDVPAVLAPGNGTEMETNSTTAIGHSPAGKEIALPLEIRTRHLMATGSWGAGKSTLLYLLALADLRAGRPVVFVDPHGTSASKLIPWARRLGLDPVVIDPADGLTDSLQVLPRFGRSAAVRTSCEAMIQRLLDAIASYQPDATWTGPRWFTTTGAALELVWVHGGEPIDAVVWLNEPGELRKRMQHDDLSPLAHANLSAVVSGSNDDASMRNWATSKLHPLVSGVVRRILAPAGKGVEVGAALAAGRPVIVNLAALSTSEAAMVSHLVTASVVDWAFDRPEAERTLVPVYLDELQRAPASGISRVLAEGRKFGVALAAATQSLGQLSGELADLAMAAGTQAVFRATPDTAARMAPILDVSARELMTQPDLHATLMVQGHPTTSVVVPPYEECPDQRLVTSPKSPRQRRTRQRSSRQEAKPTKLPDARQHRLQPTGTDGDTKPSLLDEFLTHRAELAASDDG